MMYASASISSRAVNSLLLRAVITLAALTYHTTSAQTSLPPKCSCSPTEFSFQLNFEGTCESTKLTGVSDQLCFINVRPPPPLENILSEVSSNNKRRKSDDWRRLLSREDGNNQNQRALNSQLPTRVTRVEIYEYDTSDGLAVINQEILRNQDLSDGDIISFTSISSKLDPNKSLDDQLQYFPNGIILLATGVNSNNENVTNTFAWNYDINDCTAEQIAVGDYIGWMNVADVTPANGAFCPATVTPSPTQATTTAKPISPTITPKSTKKPVHPKTSKPTSSKGAKVPSGPTSKAGKPPPSHDWSGGHHKPTPPPVYDWKDKPTTSPIYDWSGANKDPTETSSSVQPPSSSGGKSSKSSVELQQPSQGGKSSKGSSSHHKPTHNKPSSGGKSSKSSDDPPSPGGKSSKGFSSHHKPTHHKPTPPPVYDWKEEKPTTSSSGGKSSKSSSKPPPPSPGGKSSKGSSSGVTSSTWSSANEHIGTNNAEEDW
eukprot:scaffold137_cov156-Skeletonema_menzelii.AAC.7